MKISSITVWKVAAAPMSIEDYAKFFGCVLRIA